QLREQHPDLAFVAGGVVDGKALLSVSFGKDFLAASGLKAVEIIKQVGPLIRGGGGGQPDFATAGGKDPGGVDAALQEVRTWLGCCGLGHSLTSRPACTIRPEPSVIVRAYRPDASSVEGMCIALPVKAVANTKRPCMSCRRCRPCARGRV